jgi:hypothetical protein
MTFVDCLPRGRLSDTAGFVLGSFFKDLDSDFIMYRVKSRRGFRSILIEFLEGRQLLSTTPWAPAAKLIGQDLAVAHYPQITGAGEAIAVIDSGVDYKHPSLGGGLGSAYKVEAGYDFINNDSDPMSDTYAHGTGTAGVIAASNYTFNGYQDQGVAPGVRIIALREDDTAGVKSALDWVLANRGKYNIVGVNLVDFGGSSGSSYAQVLQDIIAAGVFVAHPAGNEGPTLAMRPKLDPSDFGIGSASYTTDQISTFSQRGAQLDLLAPGEDVTMPYYDVATKTHIYLDSAVGTSWSAPAVVGTAALIKQIDSRFTPAQTMQIMQQSGKSVYDPISKRTYKLLNIDAALALAYKDRGGTPVPPSGSGPVAVPPPPRPVQSPFKGTPFATNQTIQAEDFDNGGEGVAFHDLDSINIGGSAYRAGLGADVQDMTGGKLIGFAKSSEWLEYTLNVATAGTFTFSARVASYKAGGTFHIEVDGVNKTGTLTIPSSGGWQSWTTISKAGISLSAGTHIVRIKMDGNGHLGYVGNFDWIKFTPTAAVKSATTVTPAAKPATVTTRAATSTITAASANTFSGVTPQGTFMVNSLDPGDWALYNDIDFGAGATSFTATVAALKSGKRIQVRLDSANGTVIGTLIVGATGGLTTFKPQRTAITKVAGVHNVYLTFAVAGTTSLESFKFA